MIRQRFMGLRSDVASDRLRHKFLVYQLRFKGGFDPNQPRVPRGESTAGQWVGERSTINLVQELPISAQRNRQSRLRTAMASQADWEE